tara:strand:- start:189 stop:377 length:189 start_codon:yes stop_codon:yes gene_type:complete
MGAKTVVLGGSVCVGVGFCAGFALAENIYATEVAKSSVRRTAQVTTAAAIALAVAFLVTSRF